MCFYEKTSKHFDKLIELGACGDQKKAGDFTELATKWILSQVQTFSPDVFVADWMPPALYASKWLKKAGISCIASLRSEDPFLWSLMDVFASKKFPSWAVCGVFCVSRNLEEKLKNRGLPYSTITKFIPSGVKIPNYYIEDFSSLRIVFVGRLEIRQKQIVKTIEALCKATKLLPNCSVTIFGDGPNKKDVKEIIYTENCNETIKIEGPIEQDQIQERIRNHNIIVLLSDYEGTPGAIMDAMAVGIVPVCLKCPGGIEELVIDNKTGLLANDRSESFFEKLSLLSQNTKLFENLSMAARKHVIDNYSLHKSVKKWETFIAEIKKANIVKKTRLKVPQKIKLPRLKKDILCDMRLPHKWGRLSVKFRINIGRFKQVILKYLGINNNY